VVRVSRGGVRVGGEGIEFSGVSIKTVVGLEYNVWRG
jgi:hypothetical protein